MVGRFALCVALAALLAGCQPQSENRAGTDPATTNTPAPSGAAATLPPGLQFVDVAPLAGVVWTQQNGEAAGHLSMLESFGSGCAISDFDRDGQPDLFFAGGGRFDEGPSIHPVPMALFRQFSTWVFQPCADPARLSPIRHYHHGVWLADSNEDGFDDLLLTGWGGLQLFLNQGDGTFLDVTGLCGLDDDLWSLAAAWADLNGDQVLDLFIGHYVDWSFSNHPVCLDARTKRATICDPTVFQGLPCRAYLANGDGTFREAGDELGLQKLGKTLGVVTVDLNDDRRPEIYVANDTLPNFLYESQPDGTYREVAIEAGVALGETGVSDGSMGVEVCDLNTDGLFDFWVANYESQTFAYYRNVGQSFFMHSSRAFGVTAVGSDAVGFGTVVFDADLDGDQDIFCANGHIWPPDGPADRRQFPYLFENSNSRRLENVASQAGQYMSVRHLGRGAAQGDIDSDGRVDLVVTHTNEPVSLLRNDSASGQGISVELIGTQSPRDGTGAMIEVESDGVKQRSVVSGGGSYLSTSERRRVFGLGTAESAQRITVHWPAGGTTTVEDVRAPTRLKIFEKKNW